MPPDPNQAATHSPWYVDRQRRVFFDMHLPDWTRPGQSGGREQQLKGVATNFDVDALVAEFVRASVNVVVLFAKCQYGNFYYNTHIGHKHSGLGALDLVGEFIPRAHAADIKVVAYYSNGWDVEVARAHPDWMIRDASGQISYERWPRVCFNSPYRELVASHLAELFTHYSLDGVWMDMLHVLPCFCARCRAKFALDCGADMPREKKGKAWLQLVRWQQQYLDDYIRQMRAVVKQYDPEAAFTLNFYGSPYADPSSGLAPQHHLHCEYGSTEGYSEWHGLLFPSYSARYMRAAARDKPSEILISRFFRTWDFTVRPAAQIKFEAFSIAANGAAVCFDDAPYHDGRIEPQVYDALGEVYQTIAAREPYLRDVLPVYYAGLYHSLKTREVAEMLADGKPIGTTDDFYGFSPEQLAVPADPVLSTQGAFKALLEAHLPLEFLYADGLTASELERFRVVYLPNILAMSEAEADLLRDFVRRGGGLVATGATSLYDEWGQPRSNFLLADLFAVDYVSHSPYSFAFLQAVGKDELFGLGAAPLPHYRHLLNVRVNRDAKIAAAQVEPLIETEGQVYYHNNKPAPYRETGMPTLVLSQYGQGRVVYCSGEPELNYAVNGDPHYRRLIQGAVLWAAQAPYEIVPHVPLNTEVVYRERGSRRLVHFVTGWSPRGVTFHTHQTGNTIEESFPIADVRVEIPPRMQTAAMVPGNQPLEIQRTEGRAWVILPKISLWDTLVLDEQITNQETKI